MWIQSLSISLREYADLPLVAYLLLNLMHRLLLAGSNSSLPLCFEVAAPETRCGCLRCLFKNMFGDNWLPREDVIDEPELSKGLGGCYCSTSFFPATTKTLVLGVQCMALDCNIVWIIIVSQKNCYTFSLLQNLQRTFSRACVFMLLIYNKRFRFYTSIVQVMGPSDSCLHSHVLVRQSHALFICVCVRASCVCMCVCKGEKKRKWGCSG